MKYFKAFTLAEVLIALVVIGIAAAITISLFRNYKWTQYRSGALKAMAAINQANILWHTQNGETAQCAYWKTNPYKGNCSVTCGGYNSSGNCTGYVCKETGEKVPSDINGNLSDCINLYAFYIQVMNIQKVCDSNAYSNECIPKYEGLDTIYKSNHSGASDTETNQATSGCHAFRQEEILAGKAFITTDGMIFMPYNGFNLPVFLIDVNGFKGPNKYGHDIHTFSLKSNIYESPELLPSTTCNMIEKGGITSEKLIYNK